MADDVALVTDPRHIIRRHASNRVYLVRVAEEDHRSDEGCLRSGELFDTIVYDLCSLTVTAHDKLGLWTLAFCSSDELRRRLSSAKSLGIAQVARSGNPSSSRHPEA